MTRTEDRLAELLREAAPPAPPVDVEAVARRVRRRRTTRWAAVTSAGAAAAVVAAIAVPAGVGGHRSAPQPAAPSPSPPTATRGVDLTGAVPWIDQNAGPYVPPESYTQPPLTDAPACTAGDVTAHYQPRGNGAGGHLLTVVAFRDTGDRACVLQGYPSRVVAREPGLPDITATDGSFFPTGGTAIMAPGEQTLLGVETDTSCAKRPSGGPPGPAYRHLAITLPGGGTVTVRRPEGLDVTCGLALTRFYVEQPPPATPPDPLAGLHASLEAMPLADAGSTIGYLVLLNNPTDRAVSLERCPSYVETLEGGPEPVKRSYRLNCGPVGRLGAGEVRRFAMQIPAPTRPGSYVLRWGLAGPGLEALDARATITITGSRG